MRNCCAAVVLSFICVLAPFSAFAESGESVNVHFEPEVAIPVDDRLNTPIGQGLSFKVDVPVFAGLAVQGNLTALSFKATSQYLGIGSGFGGGLGLRYRLLNDNEGFFLHAGENPEGHRGNLLGNLWVDANFLLLGGSGRAIPGVDVGIGAESSLVDGLQIGPFAKFSTFGREKMVLLGLSISVGVPDPSVHDSDLDKDGINEPTDKCPNDPEDKDGHEDADGCPEKDNDGDGILDAADKCPMQAEDKDGFEDEDGCPEGDNDKDGVGDAADKCPLVPEDKDGFEDQDGCVDEDNDGDLIADSADKCPMQPEDKDGFQDEDGCPDRDDDEDGIPDTADKCRMEPETRNGIDDEDGCPEKEAKVFVENKKVEVTEKIFFGFNKSNILPKSFGLLDAVADVLNKFPQIKKLSIEGHTDDVGNEVANQALSEKRAKAVLDYLVKKGVPADRLQSVGYGKSRPIAQGKDEAAREQNRRVEFNIVDPEGGVIPVVSDPNATPEGLAPEGTDPQGQSPATSPSSNPEPVPAPNATPTPTPSPETPAPTPNQPPSPSTGPSTTPAPSTMPAPAPTGS